MTIHVIFGCGFSHFSIAETNLCLTCYGFSHILRESPGGDKKRRAGFDVILEKRP